MCKEGRKKIFNKKANLNLNDSLKSCNKFCLADSGQNNAF
jgi:hypothetical protein